LRNERYANFHTIDWLKDLAKDRFRHRWILKEKAKGKFFEKVQASFDAASGWFCVLLVGMSAGK
jgi:chloride channel 3/4/5